MRPLTQVGGRAFSFITTPPARDSWFQSYLKLVSAANARGDYHFYFISHSLVCQDCADKGLSDKCAHNYGNVPPWKSLGRLWAMLALVPAAQRQTYKTEVLGMHKDENDSYIDSRLAEALLAAPRSRPPLTETIYLAVDPASHGKSDIGLAAFSVDTTTGQLVLLGAGSVNLLRAEAVQCSMVIAQFVRRLRAVPELAEAEILKIIECNNNEISAHSIGKTIDEVGQPVRNWIKASMFKKYITPDVGVWTTHETKQAALHSLQNILLNTGRLRISSVFFTADATSYSKHASPVDPNDALEQVWEQLCRFRDTEKNQISGTAGGSEKDDVGMAVLIAIYWINAIRRHEYSESATEIPLL